MFDKNTNLPLQNATVFILSNNAPLHPFNGTFITRFKVVLLDSVLTDSEGNYVIYYRKRVGHNYYINVRHPDYIFDSKNYVPIRREKTLKHNFFMTHQ